MRIAFVAPLVTPISEPFIGGSQALLVDIAEGLRARGHEVAIFAASGSNAPGVVDTGIPPLAEMLWGVGQTRETDAFEKVYAMIDGFDAVHNHAFDVPAVEAAPDLTVHTLHMPPSDEMAAALARKRCIVACVSDAQADAWPKVDVVLHNGVPVDRIAFGSGGDGALFAGRLSAEKGAREAVEIAHRAGIEITVVGTPYDPSYTVDAPVIDALPRCKLWEVMAKSRVVLCPVQWDEPFGLVAAEAQAAGNPVIAFRRGALPDVVRNGETGYVVDDVEGAVRALDIIDRIDRSACRRHAELHLNLERTIDEHERLYEQLARR